MSCQTCHALHTTMLYQLRGGSKDQPAGNTCVLQCIRTCLSILRQRIPVGRLRSWVAPGKHQTISQLELCAALTGAQLAKVLSTELMLSIHQVTLWTDSITVYLAAVRLVTV